MGDVNGLLRLGSEPPGRRVQRAAAEDTDQTCPVRDRLLEPGLDIWEPAVVRQHVVHRPGEPATGRAELVKRGDEGHPETWGRTLCPVRVSLPPAALNSSSAAMNCPARSLASASLPACRRTSEVHCRCSMIRVPADSSGSSAPRSEKRGSDTGATPWSHSRA